MEKNTKRFTQLCIAQWEGDDGRSYYTVYGLTSTGKVFVFRRHKGGWIEIEEDLPIYYPIEKDSGPSKHEEEQGD
jgi:hypothetical protein